MEFAMHFYHAGASLSLSPFPPPLWGRVREGGTPREVGGCGTPFPNPSPKGRRERTSVAATSGHALQRKGIVV
jgi:hypothetical protein